MRIFVSHFFALPVHASSIALLLVVLTAATTTTIATFISAQSTGVGGGAAQCGAIRTQPQCDNSVFCGWVSDSSLCAALRCDGRLTQASCEPRTADVGCFWMASAAVPSGGECTSCDGMAPPCTNGCVEVSKAAAGSGGGFLPATCQRSCKYIPLMTCNGTDFGQRCQIQQNKTPYGESTAMCTTLPDCAGVRSARECESFVPSGTTMPDGCTWNAQQNLCVRSCATWQSEFSCMSWVAAKSNSSSNSSGNDAGGGSLSSPSCQWDQRRDPDPQRRYTLSPPCRRRPHCAQFQSNETACNAAAQHCAWDYGRRSCRTLCSSMVHSALCAQLGDSCIWYVGPSSSSSSSSSTTSSGDSEPLSAWCKPIGVRVCSASTSAATCFGATDSIACWWDEQSRLCVPTPCSQRSLPQCDLPETASFGLNCFSYTWTPVCPPHARCAPSAMRCTSCAKLKNCDDDIACEIYYSSSSSDPGQCRRKCFTFDQKSCAAMSSSDYCYFNADAAAAENGVVQRVANSGSGFDMVRAVCQERAPACITGVISEARCRALSPHGCYWFSAIANVPGICGNRCDRIFDSKMCAAAGCDWDSSPTAREGMQCHASCYTALTVPATRGLSGSAAAAAGVSCFLNLTHVHSYNQWQPTPHNGSTLYRSKEWDDGGSFVCQLLSAPRSVALIPGNPLTTRLVACQNLPRCSNAAGSVQPDRDTCLEKGNEACFVSESGCLNRCSSYTNEATCRNAMLTQQPSENDDDGAGTKNNKNHNEAPPCWWDNRTNRLAPPTCNASAPQTPVAAATTVTELATTAAAAETRPPNPTSVDTTTTAGQQQPPKTSATRATASAAPRTTRATTTAVGRELTATTWSAHTTANVTAATAAVATSAPRPHSNVTYAPGQKEPSTVIASVDPTTFDSQKLQQALAQKLRISPSNIIITQINDTYVEISFVGVEKPGEKVEEVVSMSAADLKSLNITSVEAGPTAGGSFFSSGASHIGALIGVIVLGIVLLIGLVYLKRWLKRKFGGGGDGGVTEVDGSGRGSSSLLEGHTRKFELDFDDETYDQELVSQNSVELLGRMASDRMI